VWQTGHGGESGPQESVAEILNSLGRAKDLVRQILTFSRKREQIRQIIPLEDVVKEAAKFLSASLPAEIDLEIKLAPDAPAVLADATQIYQVIVNLGTNALHAMEGHSTAMAMLQAGVAPEIIALWLGHESPATTHLYVEADISMKEKALSQIQSPSTRKIRFRPTDTLLRFLDGL